jgi:mono/diheme cytochrome c family protein
MQGLKSGDAYAGAQQAGWLAYNITGSATHGIGAWPDGLLAQYLSTGQAPGHGPASGPMAEAVSNSLRFLTPTDINDMVMYLRAVPPREDGPARGAPPPAATAAADPLGARIYEQACAGCHLPNGQGRQSPWAALAGSHSVADPAGTNVVQILAHGSELQSNQGQVFMHSFAGAYTDPELAAAANYAIAQIGGKAGMVTAAEIAAARR